MKVEVKIPAANGVTWSQHAADTAIGKPLLDRPDDDAVQIGKVTKATAVDGDLYLTVEVENAAVMFDLASEEVRHVSLVRAPFVRRVVRD